VKWNGPLRTDRFTAPCQCKKMMNPLNSTPAGMGRASLRIHFDTAPSSSSTRRANHSGVAFKNIGGTTNEISRCWIMCTEYRYCSPMSCSGQSAAIHNSATALKNHAFWRRVTAT
jgi:hypothetical protein